MSYFGAVVDGPWFGRNYHSHCPNFAVFQALPPPILKESGPGQILNLIRGMGQLPSVSYYWVGDPSGGPGFWASEAALVGDTEVSVTKSGVTLKS